MTEENVTVLHFPFNGGLDEKTAAEWLAPGANQAAVLNGVFNKNGAIDKRFGLKCVSHAVEGTGPQFAFSSPARVAGTKKAGLLAFTNQAAFQYSPGNGLACIGAVPNVRATRRAIVGTATSGAYANVLVDLPGVGVNYRMNVFIGTSGLMSNVFDRDTGTLVQENKILDANAKSVTQAFVYGNGSAVLVTYISPTLVYMAVEYNILLGTWGAPSVISNVSTTYGIMDTCAFVNDPNYGAISVYTTGGGTPTLNLKYIKPGLIIGSAVSLGAVALAAGLAGGSGPSLSVEGVYGETVMVGYMTTGPTFSVLPISADGSFTPGTPQTIAAPATSGWYAGPITRLSATKRGACVITALPVGATSGIFYSFSNTATAPTSYVWPVGYTPIGRGILDTDGTLLMPLLYNGNQGSSQFSGSVALMRFAMGAANYNVNALPVGVVAPRQAALATNLTAWPYMSCGPQVPGVVPTRFAVGWQTGGDDVVGAYPTAYSAFAADFFLGDPYLFQAHELGDGVHIATGCPITFDGYDILEDGFQNYPPGITTSGGTSNATHSYQYAVVYRRVDASGNILRSSPGFTAPSSYYNLALSIPNYSTQWGSNSANGLVTYWADVYRTAVDGSTFYLIGSVALPPNPAPSLLPSGNSVTYTDTAGITTPTANTILYTTGGVLDNVNPPAATIQCAHRGRIWRVDETGLMVWFSQVVTPGEAPGWNEALSFPHSEGGIITAIASMDDKLVIFKNDSVWIVSGDGPSATGQGSDLSTPQKIAGDVGALDWRSVVLTPQGIMFQATAGIYMLSRGLEVTYIGRNVTDTLAAYPVVVAATLVPPQQHARFVCQNYSGATVVVIYDYLQNAWSKAQYSQVSGSLVSATFLPGYQTVLANVSGQWVTVSSDATLWLERLPTDATPWLDHDASFVTHFVTTTVTTPWIQLNGNKQSYQRARRALLYGNNLSSVGVAMTVQSNYSPTVGQYETWPASNLASAGQVQAHLGATINKQEAIQFTFQDVAPATIGTGQGMRWVDLAVELQTIGTRYRKIPAYGTFSLTGITPATGPATGGTTITITGAGLEGATVTVGGTAATSIVYVNDYTITCVTPPGIGSQPVVVTSSKGSGGTLAFTYVSSVPTLASVVSAVGAWSVGDIDGGYSVTLTGTNFTGATGVTFGGVAATSVVVVNPTTITCTVPAHGTGSVSVVVTTPGGSNAANSLWRYYSPAQETLSGWWRGDYANPWTPTASAGTSGSHGNLGPGVAPSVGAAVNGKHPAQENGTTQWLQSAAAGSTLLSGTTFSFYALVNLASLSASVGQYVDPTIFADQAGYLGLTYSSGGLLGWIFGGGTTPANALSAGAWALVGLTYNGATLTSIVGSATQSALMSLSSPLGSSLAVGGGVGGSPGSTLMNGSIMEVITATSVLPSTADLRAYIATRYGLAV